jgi:diguanylate cyclase (GGDEF)-like protein
MIQLAFVYYMNRRIKTKNVRKLDYFSWLLIIAFCSFVADIISSFNLGPNWIYPFAVAANALEIFFNTLLLPVFFLYVCSQTSMIKRVFAKKIFRAIWILTAICIALLLSTAFSKRIFYFDEARNYHRGDLFWLPMSVLFLMMLIIECFIIYLKPQIEVIHYRSLLLFLVIPMIGWAVQFMVFGLPFSLISITFAAQVIFTNVQNRTMDQDYLTGLYNRQSLDNQMQHKIDVATSQHTFSAMLIDIDNFKDINDLYGHNEGDLALINAANLLRDSADHMDFIARYGGDEFCIIFENETSLYMESAIEHNLSEFNRKSKKPYKLGFSMGYALYNPAIHNGIDDFFREIDQEMYRKKKLHKEKKHYH